MFRYPRNIVREKCLSRGGIGKINENKEKFPGVPKNALFYSVLTFFILLTGVGVFFAAKPSDIEEDQCILGSNQKNKDNILFLKPCSGALVSPDFYLVQKIAFKGVSSPTRFNPEVFGILSEEGDEVQNRKEILEYTVEKGDSLAAVAEKFGISLNTILWANNLSKSSKISEGQKLIILQVSGVLHEVGKGETLASIAKKYKADSQEISDFNDLENENDIVQGDFLVIPNGIMPVIATNATPSPLVPLASSYFICPISLPCRMTQGLHFPNAVDFSHGKCSESIFAAAGGTVTRVKYGYNNGAGNYIQITHPNGTITTYGHIAANMVNVGEQVSQGQIIALMGGQPGTSGAGISTGCHVHFSVSGARNPFLK